VTLRLTFLTVVTFEGRPAGVIPFDLLVYVNDHKPICETWTYIAHKSYLVLYSYFDVLILMYMKRVLEMLDILWYCRQRIM
jgi:hypothetical protein